jgi:hypothetical protein
VTPAAEQLMTRHFLTQEEGIWMAFLSACHERSEEVELLFDLTDPYSLLYGKLDVWDGDPKGEVVWSNGLLSSLVELLHDLGGLLDEVNDAVWRADDVLGWVYEYYNTPDLDAVRKKARRKGLDPEDVPAANQFYTPHWVVRMLTDNTLGKLFLEHQGTLQQTIQNQDERFEPEERKDRDASTAISIEELCTYLVATEEEGEPRNLSIPASFACSTRRWVVHIFYSMRSTCWNASGGQWRRRSLGVRFRRRSYVTTYMVWTLISARVNSQPSIYI